MKRFWMTAILLLVLLVGGLSATIVPLAPIWFSDDDLRIYDDITPSKMLAFEVSEIAEDTTRTIYIGDADGNTAEWNTAYGWGDHNTGGYQAQDDVLDALAFLSDVNDNEFIVGTGAGTYAHENAATARTSLGLGTIATQDADSLTLTGNLSMASYDIECDDIDCDDITCDDIEAIRTTGLTATVGFPITNHHISTGDMIDGFGSGLKFIIEDNSGTDYVVAQVEAVRDSADNEGMLRFKAGTNGIETFATIDHSGDVDITVGSITMNAGETVDGRDVSADGTTLDGKPDLGETSTTAYRGDRGKTAYDYSQVGHLPSAGGTVTGPISVPEIANTSGDLKVMPDVQGDVVLFGDTDVGNDDSGKYLIIRRKAAEFDRHISFYINSLGTANMYSAGSWYFNSGLGYVYFKAAQDIRFNIGNNYVLRFRASDSTTLVTIDEATGNVELVTGNLFLSSIKSGATQVAAGADANELWKTDELHATLPANVVMIGE